MKQNGVQSADERRRRVLEEGPLLVGARWALDSCEGVARSGRKIEGGWPGTLPEARGRVLSALTGQLASSGLRPLSQRELTAATATAYDRARNDWRLATRSRSRKPATLTIRASRP